MIWVGIKFYELYDGVGVGECNVCFGGRYVRCVCVGVGRW